MKYIIEEKMANAILNYLMSRPYGEVANLIQGLHSMIPYSETPQRDLKSGPTIPPPGSDTVVTPFIKIPK